MKRGSWIKFVIILGDGAYDRRECFNEIAKHRALSANPVRKTVILLQKDFENDMKK